MEQAPNHLALLSRDELAAGLALLTSRSRAEQLAAEVYAIPEGEQMHYEWVYPTLILATCPSSEVTSRVRKYVGVTPEALAAFEQQQKEICAWCHERGERPDAYLTLEDVIFDTRGEGSP